MKSDLSHDVSLVSTLLERNTMARCLVRLRGAPKSQNGYRLDGWDQRVPASTENTWSYLYRSCDDGEIYLFSELDLAPVAIS